MNVDSSGIVYGQPGQLYRSIGYMEFCLECDMQQLVISDSAIVSELNGREISLKFTEQAERISKVTFTPAEGRYALFMSHEPPFSVVAQKEAHTHAEKPQTIVESPGAATVTGGSSKGGIRVTVIPKNASPSMLAFFNEYRPK